MLSEKSFENETTKGNERDKANEDRQELTIQQNILENKQQSIKYPENRQHTGNPQENIQKNTQCISDKRRHHKKLRRRKITRTNTQENRRGSRKP